MAGWELPPRRLERWLVRWGSAHAPVVRTRATATAVTFEAADGAAVECEPLVGGMEPGERDGFDFLALLAHVARDRRTGVLAVRLGAHAAAIFDGDEMVASKVARRQVHGRHRAGGQSQRRFERRRAGEARRSLEAAADVAAALLAPQAARLDAVVLAGDRRALAEVLGDRRLHALAPLVVPRVLDVPEPRLDVVRALAPRLRSTLVSEREPGDAR